MRLRHQVLVLFKLLLLEKKVRINDCCHKRGAGLRTPASRNRALTRPPPCLAAPCPSSSFPSSLGCHQQLQRQPAGL